MAPNGTWAKLRGIPNAAARPVPCWAATRMIVSVRAPQLPGPSSVPSSRIVVHGRVGAAGACVTATRSAERSSGFVSPGPSRSARPSSQLSRGHAVGQSRQWCAREEEPARRQDVAGLLLGEDLLEHAVAAHGHVAGRDVRGGDEHREQRQPDGAAAAPHVRDGEEAEREQREIGDEQGCDEAPVDLREGRRGGESEDGEQERAADREQDEPPPSRADVELARAGEHCREEPRDEPPGRPFRHRAKCTSEPRRMRKSLEIESVRRFGR